jgi:gas vesicle protein
MANSGSTLLALVTGAAIGAAVGLLYAPDSGEKTRKKLNKDAKKAQDKFNKKYLETTSNLSSKAKKAKLDFEARLEETLSSASYKADEILSAMETKLDDLKKQNSKLQKESTTDAGSTKTKKAVI